MKLFAVVQIASCARTVKYIKISLNFHAELTAPKQNPVKYNFTKNKVPLKNPFFLHTERLKLYAIVGLHMDMYYVL